MTLTVVASSGEQSVNISCQRPLVMYRLVQMSVVVAVLLTLLAPGELICEHVYKRPLDIPMSSAVRLIKQPKGLF